MARPQPSSGTTGIDGGLSRGLLAALHAYASPESFNSCRPVRFVVPCFCPSVHIYYNPSIATSEFTALAMFLDGVTLSNELDAGRCPWEDAASKLSSVALYVEVVLQHLHRHCLEQSTVVLCWRGLRSFKL
jgi:hypothetical protein